MKKNDEIARRTDSLSPSAEILTKNRKFFGLTQAQAAALIHVSTVTWQQYEQGKRSMHPAFAELFMLKAAQLDK